MTSAFVQSLPIVGMGHSLGCLLQLLIGSRYPVQNAGNVLMRCAETTVSSW